MLSRYWHWLMAGSTLWTATFALAIYATVSHSMTLMFWSLMCGSVSCMLSGWIVASCAVDRGRLEVEEIAECISRAAREADLPRARR